MVALSTAMMATIHPADVCAAIVLTAAAVGAVVYLVKQAAGLVRFAQRMAETVERSEEKVDSVAGAVDLGNGGIGGAIGRIDKRTSALQDDVLELRAGLAQHLRDHQAAPITGEHPVVGE